MNSNRQLTIVAILHARSGIEEELGRRLGELVDPSRAEAGCINYDLHRSNTDPAIWILYENWSSSEALEIHFATDLLVRLLADVDGMLAKPLQIHRLTMVSKKA
jgi:quinol monooxygenase YgiN